MIIYHRDIRFLNSYLYKELVKYRLSILSEYLGLDFYFGLNSVSSIEECLCVDK